ncbi:MAG: transglutaminase domain-containing protein [Eubacteriales bacterium]|nr:transglutaminase domain-containing protein [Eubacteriales bacterium]
MLRRHNALRVALSFLLSALTAFSLLTPLLSVAQLLPLRFFGIIEIAVFTLVFFVTVPIKTGLRPILRAVLTVLAFYMFSGGGSLINALSALTQGLPMQEIALIYSDTTLALFALLASLFGALLSAGEPAFSMPLYITSLMLLWYAGAEGDLSYYIPAALVLPLSFIINRPFAESDTAQSASGKSKTAKALAIGLVLALLAGAIAPQYPKTQPQLKEQADSLRQFINDYFFFTDSRTAFSLKNEGWQNMPDEGLGGIPNPPNAPVLEVSVEGKAWLRGTIKDHYNGRAWYDTMSDRRYGVHSNRFDALRKDLFNWNLPAQQRQPEKTIKVNVLRESASTLFVPQRVRKLDVGAKMVPYFNQASELFVTRNLIPGNSYTVSYEDYSAGDRLKTLADNLSLQTDPNYAAMQQKYTQLPPHLTPDGIVARLASLMAKGATKPYDIAKNIMDSLKNNYRYTLQVKQTPQDTDFVAHFLFDTMEGYCTYFASAMVVLARSQGLPARYIEGFLVKEHTNNPITLTSQDAHAWAEIYIPNIGWTVFDATASRSSEDAPPDKDALNELMNNNDPPPSPTPTPEPSPEPEKSDEPSQSPEHSPQPSPAPSDEPMPSKEPEPSDNPDHANPIEPDKKPLSWLWLVVLAISLIALRLYFTAPTISAKRSKDAKKQCFVLFNGFLSIMQESGRGKSSDETIIEYALRQNDQDLLSLSRQISAITYGNKTPTKQTVEACLRLYQNTFKSTPLIPKLRLLIKRLPPKKERLKKISAATVVKTKNAVANLKRNILNSSKKSRKRK